jgi:hypothetical protein
LWYWGWRLSAFPPVEATLDAEGDTGAGLKRRFPCCSKTVFSKVFGAGAKTHFQNPKVPLGGGVCGLGHYVKKTAFICRLFRPDPSAVATQVFAIDMAAMFNTSSKVNTYS